MGVRSDRPVVMLLVVGSVQDQHLSFLGFQQSYDGLEQDGFPGTACSYYQRALSWEIFSADVSDGRAAVEVFCQVTDSYHSMILVSMRLKMSIMALAVTIALVALRPTPREPPVAQYP